MHIPPYGTLKEKRATVLPSLGISQLIFQKISLGYWWHFVPNFMPIGEFLVVKTMTEQKKHTVSLVSHPYTTWRDNNRVWLKMYFLVTNIMLWSCSDFCALQNVCTEIYFSRMRNLLAGDVISDINFDNIKPKSVVELKEMLQSIWEPIDKAVKKFQKWLKAYVALWNILIDCGIVNMNL